MVWQRALSRSSSLGNLTVMHMKWTDYNWNKLTFMHMTLLPKRPSLRKWKGERSRWSGRRRVCGLAGTPPVEKAILTSKSSVFVVSWNGSKWPTGAVLKLRELINVAINPSLFLRYKIYALLKNFCLPIFHRSRKFLLQCAVNRKECIDWNFQNQAKRTLSTSNY